MEKLKNIKIAFVDIDGTLSNSKKEITKETSEIIKKVTNKGLKVVLCSGRGNRYTYNCSKRVNASNYIICSNGAEIFDYEQDIHLSCSKIDFIDIKKVWSYCCENGICCLLNGKNIRYCNKHSYIHEDDKILIDNIEDIKDIDIYQLVTIGKNYNVMCKMEIFLNSVNNLKISNTSSTYINKRKDENYFFFDITNKHVSKGNAIKHLLNYLQLTKENAIGFGDHVNDFDLFGEVGFKIAMGNANVELKDKADYITLSNNENGVGYFLDNFINYD